MGNGDFKLLAALGAWLGVGILPVLIFMAALVGLVGALIARVGKGQYFAFGPSLAVAGWIILVANAPIAQLVQWCSYNQDSDNDIMDRLDRRYR